MNGFVSTVYIIVISILFVILTFLLSVILLERFLKEKLIVQKRIKKFWGKQIKSDIVKPKAKKIKKEIKLKFSQKFASQLKTAGILMRVEEFATIWILSSFVPSGIIALITGNAGVALLFAVIGIILPPAYIKKQKKKRVAAFENQLSDALVIICNCLRSGLTISQAFENIADEMPEPISKEFSAVCTEIKYGSTLEKALNSLSERIGSDDLMLTVTAINIQRQVGGNLSEILQNISDTIKSRIKLKNEIKVMTASGRASGIIIGLLPIGIGIMIFLLNPEYMLAFVETSIGKIMLCVGAVMEIIGFLVIKKIISIKY